MTSRDRRRRDRADPRRDRELDIRRGKKVCELLLIPTDKGKALSTVRATVGATAVLFLGDDVTDEYAFRTPRPRCRREGRRG